MSAVPYPSTPWFRFAAGALAVAGALALAACGGQAGKDKPATQVAVKVNKEELSVHQVNYQLQRQPGLKPEQADAATRQVLERLVDEELALQKAQELKIDRDPKVLQAVDAARREIIARAYLERIGDAATRPSADEVRRYYDANPALFKERRIYTLQEIAVEAEPAQLEALKARLAAAKTTGEFIEYLKSSRSRYAVSQAVRAAEQLPLASLPSLAKMKDGQALLLPSPNGAQVVAVLESQPAPVDETKARPAIEQFLWNESRRRMVQGDLKALRGAGKIEYVGKYAELATVAPAAASAAR